MLLFFLFEYVRAHDPQEFYALFENGRVVLSLFAVTLFSAVAMFLYFYFEERDFLRKATNSEMLFIILHLSLLTSQSQRIRLPAQAESRHSSTR